jgi:hypothetical protein
VSAIFISHATRDGADAARQLVAALEAAGRTCWIMGRDIEAGAPFPGQIVAAIRESCGLVLLLTPGANQSRDVLQEVHKAHSEGKVIVPVVLQGTKPSDNLSYFVDVRQQITWTEPKAVAKALAGVFTAHDAPSARTVAATATTPAHKSAVTPAETDELGALGYKAQDHLCVVLSILGSQYTPMTGTALLKRLGPMASIDEIDVLLGIAERAGIVEVKLNYPKNNAVEYRLTLKGRAVVKSLRD